jgi:type IV secretion system coupling TraD/TrwB family protein
MNKLLALALTCAAALGAYCFWVLPDPWNFAAAPVLLGLAYVMLTEPDRRVRIGGMSWTPAEVCQHFFVTGATGTSKTQSAIHTLATSFLATFPRCSAVFLDVKGVVHTDVVALSKWASREKDHVLLKSRSHKDPPEWRPTHTINLTGNPHITSATYAKLIADTYTCINKSAAGDPFWPSAAQLIIQHCLEALRFSGAQVTIPNVARLAKDHHAREQLAKELSESQQGMDLATDLLSDFSKPEETLASILAFVDNYLAPFLHPSIAEVFCAEQPTFSFDQLDEGKLLCISIPPSFQAERIYINTFLKFGAYMHLQMRFQQIDQIEEKNMVFIFADEGQEVVTAAESAFADHRQLATIREAKGCFVLATQTYESLTTALGKDRADVMVANLVTHIIFKCATKETSEWAATSIGDRTIREKSCSWYRGRRTVSFRPVDEAIIKPHKLRKLPKFSAIVVHPSGRYRKVFLPPISPATGQIAPWFFSRFSHLAALHPVAVFLRTHPKPVTNVGS